jgi:hypothetical protein
MRPVVPQTGADYAGGATGLIGGAPARTARTFSTAIIAMRVRVIRRRRRDMRRQYGVRARGQRARQSRFVDHRPENALLRFTRWVRHSGRESSVRIT